MNNLVTKRRLRSIIKSMLAEAQGPYTVNKTGEMRNADGSRPGGGRPGGRRTSPEEEWTASVRKGERGAKRHRYSGAVQDDIDATESYLDDVGMGAAQDEMGPYMYGDVGEDGLTDEELASVDRDWEEDAVMGEGYENIGNRVRSLADDLNLISADIAHTVDRDYEPLAPRIPREIRKRMQEFADDIMRIADALDAIEEMKGGKI